MAHKTTRYWANFCEYPMPEGGFSWNRIRDEYYDEKFLVLNVPQIDEKGMKVYFIPGVHGTKQNGDRFCRPCQMEMEITLCGDTVDEHIMSFYSSSPKQLDDLISSLQKIRDLMIKDDEYVNKNNL